MRRTSYQKGSLRLADHKKGKVWEFLWREVQLDGSIRRKHIVIGTLEDLPTESSAQAAVDAIRLEINRQTPQQLINNISFEALVNHYGQHELPDIFNKTKPSPGAAEEDCKSYSTQVTYEGYLKRWILPRWRVCRLTEVRAVEVEKWLRSLSFPKSGVPLARGSKAKNRNIMSALYSHAIRWEWADKNPITSVRQSAKRRRSPDVLTPQEIMAFLKELSIHFGP
jgi:integrase